MALCDKHMRILCICMYIRKRNISDYKGLKMVDLIRAKLIQQILGQILAGKQKFGQKCAKYKKTVEEN